MVVSAIKTCHHTVVSSVQFSSKKRIITSQGICEAQNIIVINIIAITTPQLRRSTFFLLKNKRFVSKSGRAIRLLMLSSTTVYVKHNKMCALQTQLGLLLVVVVVGFYTTKLDWTCNHVCSTKDRFSK